MIPKGWKEQRVGDALVIENTKRKPLSAEERATMQGPFPYYGPTQIQDWINEYAYDGRYALIGEDGDHFLKYKTQSMTQIIDGHFNVNNHAHAIQGTDSCTTDWFYFYFQNRSVESYLTRQGAKRYKLTKASLEDIPIILPPMNEQRRIIEILSTWDRAIEMVEALIANARTQKQALMQSLLTGKKRLPGFSGDWRSEKLGSLCQITKGEQLGRLAMLDDGTVPVINGGVTPSGFTDRSNNPGGCITISEGGNSCGFVSLMSRPFWCGGHCYALKQLTVDRSFLFASLKHREPEIMTLRVGSGLPNIQKKALAGFELLVAPRPEQEAIGKLADLQDREICGLEGQSAALRQEKSALMQQLLTGKRRVKITEKEHA